MPGGPLEVYLSNPGVRPEDLERLKRALGLDRSLWVQYVSWLGAFVTGDWGYSFSDGRPVLARVVERLPASAELLLASFALALVVALPSGLIAAVRRGTIVDRALSGVAAVGVSLPAFWLGLMLQLAFAIGLGWLPSAGRAVDGGWLTRLSFLVMPAAVLAFVHAAAWMRYLRASMVDVLGAPFIAAASARGLPRRARLLRHALPNALAPVITVVLLDAALLVPGAVVTESVFAWPGVGSLFTEALGRRDYSVLMALLMASSVAVILFNLVADLLHAWLDPRVRA
ncbi:MAG: ABC transporter permease [Acidobacteria bacterium]|nr:ABC transporter permease [Acidobacteriota bacterium]